MVSTDRPVVVASSIVASWLEADETHEWDDELAALEQMVNAHPKLVIRPFSDDRLTEDR